MSKIALIAAVAEKGAIGQNQQLLCHLPNDLKHFKTLTSGHTVVMGRKTFESLPNGALPNRKNIVLTHNTSLSWPNVTVVHTLDEIPIQDTTEDEIFNQPDEFVIFARASGVEYWGDEHQQGGTVP